MGKKKFKILQKLYFKKWIIGICSDSIESIIKNKEFDPKIHWLKTKNHKKLIADPFFLSQNEKEIKIIYEELCYKDNYGKIALMSLDKNFKQLKHKTVLDTNSHLSYPFVFKENGNTFVFPESRQSGNLSCYKYDEAKETLIFVKNILNRPLVDSTIFQHENIYWLFCASYNNDSNYELNIYYSEMLLGTYKPHPQNPIKKGLDGIRSAGNLFVVDGTLYRPSQNCANEYGESITLNRIIELSTQSFIEEYYMTLAINKNNLNNRNIHTIHTINQMNGIILVDGIMLAFRPIYQIKEFLKRMFKRQAKRFYGIF